MLLEDRSFKIVARAPVSPDLPPTPTPNVDRPRIRICATYYRNFELQTVFVKKLTDTPCRRLPTHILQLRAYRYPWEHSLSPLVAGFRLCVMLLQVTAAEKTTQI